MQKPTNLSVLPFLKSLQNINHRVGASLVWIKEKGSNRWMQGLGNILQLQIYPTQFFIKTSKCPYLEDV